MSDSVVVSAVLNSEEAPQVEETSEVVVEEVSAPASEEVSEPVASSEPEVEEEAPVVPSTQEVVQNVQEMLSSTDTSGSVNELENRVKVLEERLEKLITLLSGTNKLCEIDDDLFVMGGPLSSIHEQLAAL